MSNNNIIDGSGLTSEVFSSAYDGTSISNAGAAGSTETIATWGDLIVMGLPGYAHSPDPYPNATQPSGSWGSAAVGAPITSGGNGKAFLYNKSTDTTVELVQPSGDINHQQSFGYGVVINDSYVAVLAPQQTYYGRTPKIYLYDHAGVYQDVRIEGPQMNSSLGMHQRNPGIFITDSYIVAIAATYNNNSSRVHVYDLTGTELGYISSGGGNSIHGISVIGNTVITGSASSLRKYDITGISNGQVITSPTSTLNTPTGYQFGSIEILDNDYFVVSYLNKHSTGHFEVRKMSDLTQVGSDFVGNTGATYYGNYLACNGSGLLAVSTYYLSEDLGGYVDVYSHNAGSLTLESTIVQSDAGTSKTTYSTYLDFEQNSLVVADRNAHLVYPFTVGSSVQSRTITVTGDVQQGSFSPYVAGGYSTEISSGYIDIASSSNFAIGTGDFTFETWVKVNTDLTGPIRIFALDGASGEISSSVYCKIDASSVTTALGVVTTSVSFNDNAFHHVAVSRSSGTTKIFVNGAEVSSEADTTSYTPVATPSPRIMNGAGDITISDMRLVKGVGLYTSAFTAPTSALTLTDETVLLTCNKPYMSAVGSVNVQVQVETGNFVNVPKIVVGASNDDDNGTDSGSVYVYDLDGSNEVKITASDAAAGDRFGWMVAASVNKIVVGASNDDDNGTDSGSVYVYDLDGSNEVKITASDGAAGDWFGYSVAISGNKIVVVASNDDDNGSDSGSVYVYDLDGSNEVKITASDGAAYDGFGYSVAASDNKIVVGALNDDDDGSNSGSVYVYDLDGSNEVKITASDGAAYDGFGYSVAISDNKIVVGARYDDDNGSDSGSVYVYDLDGSNEVKITSSDAAAGDGFGYSVAISDNKIVVGASNDDDDGSNSGSVYIYDLDGSNEVKITASDAAAGDGFGYSVAASDNKIVVGVWKDDDDGSMSGSVYIYDLDGSNEVKITASDAAAGDRFGFSVSAGTSQVTEYVTTTQTSTSRRPTTLSGDVSTERTSPYSYVDYSAASHGGSAVFDGTGDYLAISSSDDFDLGTADFTVEMWVNASSFVSEIALIDARSSDTNSNYGMFINTSGQPYFRSASGSKVSTVATNINVWTHVAFSRSSGDLSIYVNGVLGYNGALSDSLTQSGYNIGVDCVNAKAITGKLSDVRLVKESAVYTADFTPPTAPLTAVTGTKLLLPFDDATIFDRTGSGIFELKGTPTISTADSPYGANYKSLEFDGSTDYIEVDNDLLGFDGNFTAEAWIKPTSTAGQVIELADGSGIKVVTNGSNYDVVFHDGSSDLITSSSSYSTTASPSLVSTTEGTANSDAYGWDAAATDSYYAISTPNVSSNSGKVDIYSTATDELLATVTNPNPSNEENDYFGRSIAMTETHLLVGASGVENSANTDNWSGAAYLYEISTGGSPTFTLVRTLRPADLTVRRFFGCAVALSDTHYAIGSQHDDNEVFLFSLADYTSSAVHTFSSSDPKSSEYYGGSLFLNSTHIMINDMAYDSWNSGKVYIYDLTSSYTLIHEITETRTSANNFGGNGNVAMAMNANYFFIGGEASNNGYIQVHNMTDGAILHDLDGPVSQDAFGKTIHMDDTYLFVGSAYNVFVYELSGDFSAPLYSFAPSGVVHADGLARSLSSVGTKIIVGAPGFDPSGLTNAGGAYVYELPASDWSAWKHVAVSRRDSAIKLFVDGTSVGSASSSATIGSEGTAVVGAGASGTDKFTGLISDIRVSSSNVYYSDFTAPSAPLTLDTTEDPTETVVYSYPMSNTSSDPTGSYWRDTWGPAGYTFVANVGITALEPITDMSHMFSGAASWTGDADMNSWDVSGVTSMFGTFGGAQQFNTNIGNWNTSSVTIMSNMFLNTDFNQDISNWDTSKVGTDLGGHSSAYAGMRGMFQNTPFDQDISSWNVENISSAPTDFDAGTPGTWTASEKPQWGTDGT